MAGAAVLSGKGAYRSGAGLVRILTDESNRQILQTCLPDAILTTCDYSEDPDHPDRSSYSVREKNDKALDNAIRWAQVIGIGPGLGTSIQACRLLERVLRLGKVPLVIDADGINVLARMMKENEHIHKLYQEYPYGMILTPHPGEMARLTGRTIGEVTASLIPSALSAADEKHVIVLKDAVTVVAGGGCPIWLNSSGNSGMAVGGSGDVLTGIICGLLAQYEAGKKGSDDNPDDKRPLKAAERLVRAARLGVYCHGLAGDLAAGSYGKRGLTASDLPEAAAKIMER